MDSSHEMDRLRIELQEKNIQVEAMMQFEHEFGLKVENLVAQKDKRICELESQLNDLSLMTPQLDERNTNLARMLRDKELEVEALEIKVEAIMSEQAQRAKRSSLTESMLDFEKRVEDLRRELTGKDCEIRQLRDILDTNVPSTSSSSPEPPSTRPALSLVGQQTVTVSPRMDELNTLRSRLDLTLEELESLKLSFLELPRELPQSVLRSSEAVVNVCTEQVREYKQTADRYKRELALLKKAIDDPREPHVQALLLQLEDTLRHQRLIQHKQELDAKINFACTVETATSPVDHRTMSLECHPHILIPGSRRKLMLESHDSLVIDQVVSGRSEAVAVPTLDGIAKRLREETQIRRQVEDENESLRSQLLQETRKCQLSLRDTQTEIESLRSQVETLGCVKSDLKSRESDMRTIRGEILELKKEIQVLELEKEEHESEKRKMQRTIDQLRQAKQQSSRHDQDMKEELEKLRKRLEQKKVKSLPVVVPKPRRDLSVVSAKVVSWNSGTAKDVVVGVSSDLLVRLQTQLTQTEEELAACKRELLVESKRDIEMERLKSAHLQNQLMTLQLKLEDVKQRSHHPEMDLCLAAQKTETDLELISRESQSKDIEIIRLKSKILDLEFERTELIRRAERAIEKRDMVQAQLLKLKSVESIQHLPNETVESLKAELEKVSGEKKQLLIKLRESQKRETSDKVALEEAERVLNLVQVTESKYLKVAKENAKLRKDLSSLNDDTFWADLEALQNDHKEATMILRKMMPIVTDENLQSRIRKLTNSSS